MALEFRFFGGKPVADTTLPDIFPVPILEAAFVRNDVAAIFSKILTDVIERTQGLSDDQVEMMWDNCVMDSSAEGLVTRLSNAMASQADLFLVYEAAVGVIRLATGPEQQQIKSDYLARGESSVGIYVSFRNFHRAEMVKFYAAMEYATVGSMHKSMNLAKAVQIKISKIREGVSLADAPAAIDQAKALAAALGAGRDVMLDAEDEIVTSAPDLTAVKEGIAFITQKLSFYLGLPASYLTGEQTGGIGSTGENDMRAVERGLKAYFYSVVKPVLEALFGGTYAYKSQDFRQAEGAVELLKVFALIDDTLISQENKRRIINRLLDLPEDAEGDAPVTLPLATAPRIPLGRDA